MTAGALPERKDHRLRVPPQERYIKVEREILRSVKFLRRATYASLLETTELARSALSAHLKGLVTSGQLSKDESPEDARIVYYSLAPMGENLLAKEEAVSRLEAAPAEAVLESKIAIELPPYSRFNSLLDEVRTKRPLETTINSLAVAVIDGLSASTSATVLSDRELRPEFIDQYMFSQVCTSVLGHLMDEGLNNAQELQKKLDGNFREITGRVILEYVGRVSGCPGWREVLQSRLAEGVLPDAADLIERLTDEEVKAQRSIVDSLKKLFGVRFHIDMEYDGKGLSPFLNAHLDRLEVLRLEIRQFCEQTMVQELVKRMSTRTDDVRI